jgi:hypothetical protein
VPNQSCFIVPQAIIVVMRTAMSGGAHVHYGQIYVQSGDVTAEMPESFGGQRNGLCGAAVPGALLLMTGLHTGTVGFAVEVHDSAPPVDDRWEEIVEVPFRPVGETMLVTWGGEDWWPLDLAETDHRVRYCGTGMDAGRARDTRLADEPEVDHYLLQLWPAPPEPERLVKQTSEAAAHWHGYAREQPPPPTPAEVAETERLAGEKAERQAVEARHRRELAEWGGQLPSERLRRMRGPALYAVELDRDLAERLAGLDGVRQREIARWTIRRVLAEAGLTQVDWITAALDAVDRGDPLPPPFEDAGQAWHRLLSDPRVPRTLVTTPDGRHDNALQQAMAFPALLGAKADDPLRAVFGALHAGVVTFGRGRQDVFLAEVREKLTTG